MEEVRYKLIKCYPGHETLGEEVWFSSISCSDEWYGTSYYSRYTEFWEEVKSLKYVILTIINDGTSIRTVQRLSDKAVFNIGDKIGADVFKNNKIEKFDIQNGNMYVITSSGTTPLHLIYHAKTPILITEDNVELFEGDSYWFIWVTDSCARGQKPMTPYYVNHWTTVMGTRPAENAKYFSTKQAVEEYIHKHTLLATTQDGVNVHEGTLVYFVNSKEPNMGILCCQLCKGHLTTSLKTGWIIFSTREKAQEYIEKQKVLFVTEDGVGIKDWDSCWSVTNSYNISEFQHWRHYYGNKGVPLNLHCFSTKEKAQEYIDMNKPQYSFKDVENMFIKKGNTNGCYSKYLQILKDK